MSTIDEAKIRESPPRRLAEDEREYQLEQLRRPKREVEIVLGVDVELDRLVGRFESSAIDLEVDRAIVRLLDDVHLHPETLRHRPRLPAGDNRRPPVAVSGPG